VNDSRRPPENPPYTAAEASSPGAGGPVSPPATPVARSLEHPGPPAPDEGWSDPGPAGTARGWGPGRVAIGIATLLVATLFEVGIVSAFDPGLESLAGRLVTQALLAITLVVVAFALTADPRCGIVRPATVGLRRPLRAPFGLGSSLGTTAGAFVAAAIAYLSYIAVAAVYSNLLHPEQKDITRDLGFGDGGFGTAAAALLIVIAAPLSEEIFFRGFIFGGLRRRLPFVAAALISAAIFGVFHYTGAGSLAVLPQLAFLGFALAWVYEQTGSIYPAIAIHVTNNLLAFIVLTS
jgi:membrane protease YdiL (CAAX protease family)